MYVFIDDSGDTGFKFDSGSSNNFVIACCVFKTAEDVAIAANRIRKLRSDLGWSANSEFKFSRTNSAIRDQFLNMALDLPFFVRAINVNKHALENSGNTGTNGRLLLETIELVLLGSSNLIVNAKVFIDGQAARNYARATSRFIKSQTNKQEQIVSSLRFIDSGTNDLIQLADMIAGAVRRKTEGGFQGLETLSKVDRIMKKPGGELWMFPR